MIISLIAAADLKNGIGLNGSMPWGRIKEDMAFFRETTAEFPIVMGRITFESLGNKPLPYRKNIVLSSSAECLKRYDNLSFQSSFEETLSELLLEKHKQIFIIGGESIYRKAMDYADIIYLTRINKDYKCDRFFPDIDEKVFSKEKIKNFLFDSIEVNVYKYIKNI